MGKMKIVVSRHQIRKIQGARVRFMKALKEFESAMNAYIATLHAVN